MGKQDATRGRVIMNRRVGDKIVVGEGDSRIEIEVLRASTKIAVSAPRSVAIRREDRVQA